MYSNPGVFATLFRFQICFNCKNVLCNQYTNNLIQYILLFVLVSLHNAQSFVNEINQFVYKINIFIIHFLPQENYRVSLYCAVIFRGQNPKSLTGGWSRLRHRVKVDSGIGFLMVNVLGSTLEWTLGDDIVSSGIQFFFFGFGPQSLRSTTTSVATKRYTPS